MAQDTLVNQIILLALTFLFTSVLGGFLAANFQNRTWKHQNRVKLAKSERHEATKIFESISSLMDKRLYRMRQLNWKLKDDTTSPEKLEETMIKYREVLYEWNDNLNRNLALAQCYFGKDIRKILEGNIYEKFREIGSFLENGYLEKGKTGKTQDFKKSNLDITDIRDDIYELNVKMIELIQKGEVGIFNPDTNLKSKDLLLLHKNNFY